MESLGRIGYDWFYPKIILDTLVLRNIKVLQIKK